MQSSPLSRWYGRLRAVYPAGAFLGGFLWDALTFSRHIRPASLFLLGAYLIGAGAILIALGRRARDEEADPSTAQWAAALMAEKSGAARLFHMAREEGPVMALQFFFGGLFSALVVFYFLSSSYLPSLALVVLLAALLCWNEFLKGHYRRRFTLTWTLFCVCAILFLNFALPHLFRSVNPIWFYVSTASALLLVFAIRKLSPRARGSLWPAVAVAAALMGLYAVNAIPPVPMVKKTIAICRGLEKKEKEGWYAGVIELQPVYAFWRHSESVVHQRPGEKIFCFTSVFLPNGIECTLYHRWLHQDARSGKWIEYSRIGFPIRGGRQEGYRGFTYKRNLDAGRWQVRLETEAGRVLGTLHFSVAAAPENAPLVFQDLILR